MRATLNGAGYSTELIPANDELPVSALIVDLGEDDLERRRMMSISVMPFGDDQFAATSFVQYYVRLPFEAERSRMDELGHAIAIVNGAMALGHFGVRGTELFYRYMHAQSSSATTDDALLLELLPMLIFHQEHFGDYLEGVLDDEVAVAVLPKLIAQSDPE